MRKTQRQINRANWANLMDKLLVCDRSTPAESSLEKVKNNNFVETKITTQLL